MVSLNLSFMKNAQSCVEFGFMGCYGFIKTRVFLSRGGGGGGGFKYMGL
jgi:hypothetical protein